MKINLDNLKNKNKMKNVIFTCLLSFAVVSISFGQLKVIAPNGDVGIGITTPTAKLHVDGKSIFKGDMVVQPTDNAPAVKVKIGVGRTVAGNSFIDTHPFADASPGSWMGRLISTPAGLTSFAHRGDAQFALRSYDSPIILTTGDTQKFFIELNGNVGIGIASPTALLHVNGSAVKPGGGMWGTASDENLKKDVNEFNKGLAEIMKIRPVTFKYNGLAGIEDTETVHTGLIAQEFAKVAPEATFKYKHTEVMNAGSSEKPLKRGATTEYMGIDPSQITYMLVNAVKEQQEVIENLRNQVEEMAKVGFTAPAATDHVHYSTVVLNGENEKAMLAQNAPNPFTKNTKIDYFVPTNSRKASMSFTDITGKEVKRINIDHTGLGTLDVSIADMPIGIYSYSLIIDNSTIASKKMVLSK